MKPLRLLRHAAAGLLSLVVLSFAIVQFQQHRLRWRSEHLLSDMHHIRLYQTTWAEAQELMKRWGAAGHYHGTCTPENCTYDIALSDLSSSDQNNPRSAWILWLLQHDRLNLYEWFGGRPALCRATFTVHNGTIWRQGSGIAVTAGTRQIQPPPGSELPFSSFDLTLSAYARSRDRLSPIKADFVFPGPDDQLTLHPFYKATRPDSCMIHCEEAIVTYSTRTPLSEIVRLTSFHLGCITRWQPCTRLDQLLPAEQEWDLYGENRPTASLVSATQPQFCQLPLWTLARDARSVLVVDTLATTVERTSQGPREMSVVRIERSLKGSAPWLPGDVVKTYSFPGSDLPPLKQAEHLPPHSHLILFPVITDRRDSILSRASPITLDQCGAKPDNPSVRRELQKGFAQNDALTP